MNKQPITARNWAFTLWYPRQDQLNHIQSINGDICKYIVYGHELSEDDKPHIQGYIELNKTARLTGIKKILEPNMGKNSQVHVEMARSGREFNAMYCKKGLQPHEEWDELKEKGPSYGLNAQIYEQEFKAFREGQGQRTDWHTVRDIIRNDVDNAIPNVANQFPDLFGKYSAGVKAHVAAARMEISKEELQAEYSTLDLYTWENKLLSILSTKPDDRKIYWYVDPVGGNGKSTFCKYLCATHKAIKLESGKTTDIAHAYNGEPIVLFDLSRTQESVVNYGAIESIKNGHFFSGKYDSCSKFFKIPHVVVFSNFPPRQDAFSADRICTISLDKAKDCLVVPGVTITYADPVEPYICNIEAIAETLAETCRGTETTAESHEHLPHNKDDYRQYRHMQSLADQCKTNAEAQRCIETIDEALSGIETPPVIHSDDNIRFYDSDDTPQDSSETSEDSDEPIVTDSRFSIPQTPVTLNKKGFEDTEPYPDKERIEHKWATIWDLE